MGYHDRCHPTFCVSRDGDTAIMKEIVMIVRLAMMIMMMTKKRRKRTAWKKRF